MPRTRQAYTNARQMKKKSEGKLVDLLPDYIHAQYRDAYSQSRLDRPA